MAGQPPLQPDSSGFSNYPRNSYGGGGDPSYNPNQRPPGIYFDFIGIAWKLVQQNLGTWVIAVLLSYAIGYAASVPFSLLANLLVNGSLASPRQPTLTLLGAQLALSLIPSMAVQVVHTGLLYMGVKQARGQVIEIGDLFFGFRRFGSLAISALLYSICVTVGLCLLIIPGILLAGMLVFVPLLILERNMTLQEAYNECISRIGTKGFSIFALMFVAGLTACLGLCLCGVGFLFTYPIYIVTMGLTYNTFYPPIDQPMAYAPIGIEPPRY